MKIPGINAEIGLSLYDGDVELYADIIQSFAENIPEELDKLRVLNEQELKEYAIDVHTIKGSAASIGAKDLAEWARKLEQMAKSGDYIGVAAENEAFIKDAETLISEINKWSQSHQNGEPFDG